MTTDGKQRQGDIEVNNDLTLVDSLEFKFRGSHHCGHDRNP